MIHIIIGTKAQFIKMAPVIKGLESRNISYNLINLKQHATTVKKVAKRFGIQGFDSSAGSERDLSSIFALFKWFLSLLTTIVLKPASLKRKIFKGDSGLVLIHGDTLSALVGLLMAKRGGLKVAHLESGLRSWNNLHPFPEELIRVVCMRFSDYLFAPSDEDVDNLNKMNVKGQIFNTMGNTGADAVRMVLRGEDSGVKREKVPQTESKPYVLVSIHRFENLYSWKRFRFILHTVDRISRDNNVVFVMHGPTERKLKRSGISIQTTFHTSRFTPHEITYLPLQDYPEFLKLISESEFVLTDGGSVQEECSYLGKPCLIMRERTERADGIGENAMLGRFDKEVIDSFVSDYKKFDREALKAEKSPSDLVISEIVKLA